MNGINKVAHNLALHQQKMGFQVFIWGITPTLRRRPGKRPYGLRLFKARKPGLKLDNRLKSAISELDPETTRVHIHGSFIPEFWAVGKLLKAKRIPYVYCPHGSLSPGALKKSSWKKKIYFRLFEANLIRHAQAVHFLGKTQYEAFDKWMKVGNKVIIPNGQNQEELAFSPWEISRSDAIIFSYCGRLARNHKGLDILLEGFARYRESGGSGLLWLIGDGPDRGGLEAMARALELKGSVTFWGSQYGAEKLNLLSHSDAFIHSSRYEGLPTGVLEAAGLGLACLLSTPTNLGEIFEQAKAGIHIKQNHPSNIAETLKKAESLKNKNLLAPMGDRAKKLILTHFDWENIAGEVIEKCYGLCEIK